MDDLKFILLNLVFWLCAAQNDAADQNQRPFQVTLLQNGQFICGGAIIDSLFVVTAAHCTFGQKPNAIKIGAGSMNYTSPKVKKQAVKIIQHENFKFPERHDDIALIKVDSPFSFDESISSVPLPQLNADATRDILFRFDKSAADALPGSKAIQSGWGKLIVFEAYKPMPEILQIEDIYVKNRQNCANDYKSQYETVYETNICGFDNSTDTSRGTCNGDSGGPLTLDGKLVGVLSWSMRSPECGTINYPFVYTRVSSYIDWIIKGLKN